MTSAEYRKILARIVYNVIKKRFPGLNRIELETGSREISINIHARMYGANVDGVDSPIWRNQRCSDKSLHAPPNLPKVDATELLKGNDDEKTVDKSGFNSWVEWND